MGDAAAERDTRRRVETLELAMGAAIDDWRFVPYLQRHEMEALVLAGLDQLESLVDGEDERAGVRRLAASLAGVAPEDVDDGPATAPSKRLKDALRSYAKTTHGPLVMEAVGLEGLRAACPRFDGWVGKLEEALREPVGGGGGRAASTG